MCCLIIHSIIGWFANRFATWFIRWIAHWLLKLNQMIDPNLISINWAQTFECMNILAERKIVNRIKNFERAVIVFNASNDAQKIF